MSKVIVIDRCGICPHLGWRMEGTKCLKADREIINFLFYSDNPEVPDWCPLRPLPDDRYEENFDWTDLTQKENAAMNHGWNKCLKAITGGK